MSFKLSTASLGEANADDELILVGGAGIACATGILDRRIGRLT
jgi:hypothetical protein